MSGERSGMGECIRGDGDVEWIEGRVGVRGFFFHRNNGVCRVSSMGVFSFLARWARWNGR